MNKTLELTTCPQIKVELCDFITRKAPRFKEVKEELERRNRKKVEEEIVEELLVFQSSFLNRIINSNRLCFGFLYEVERCCNRQYCILIVIIHFLYSYVDAYRSISVQLGKRNSDLKYSLGKAGMKIIDMKV